MGSVVSPGAIIESGSFLAAGAHVRAGQVVKSGELWGGIPAKKLKVLSEKQKKQLIFQADEYVKLSKRHKHVMDLGGTEIPNEELLRMEKEMDENRMIDKGESSSG